jgi:hypothetical protein
MELQEISRFLLHETITIKDSEVSLYQSTDDENFSELLLNNKNSRNFIEKISCDTQILTIAFTIYGDPKKLNANVRKLYECFKDYSKIEYNEFQDEKILYNILQEGQVTYELQEGKLQIDKLQVKYLDRFGYPLTINTLNAWAKKWINETQDKKFDVYTCLYLIASFTRTQIIYFSFNELEIIGYFPETYISLNDQNIWVLCRDVILNSKTEIFKINRSSPYPSDPMMETLSTICLSPYTRKVKLYLTQIENLLLKVKIKPPVLSFETIEADQLSHVVLEISSDSQLFKLNLNALKCLQMEEEKDGRSISWEQLWSLAAPNPHPHSFYIAKELPLLSKPYYQQPVYFGCSTC